MKKSLIFCLFILCSLCRVQGQTEVCLVGTKHNPCTYFNSDSVYAILLRVQPDVVLMELDSTFFDKNFRFDLEKYPDLLSTNENIGAHRYQQERGVDLRPFEIGIGSTGTLNGRTACGVTHWPCIGRIN